MRKAGLFTKNRIDDKIIEIARYLGELSEIVPENLEIYKKDFKTKAACERYAEKIIEAMIDLAFLVIKERGLRIPEDDENSFAILSKEDIISEELAEKLRDAKGMRNIIAHEYGMIDDGIVFNSLRHELANDVQEFIDRLD